MNSNDDSNDISAQLPRTYTIFRPMHLIEGPRLVRDPVGRLMVSAFPAAMTKGLAPVFAGVAACYLLADDKRVYIGESKKVDQRLLQHAADPSKSFTREIYVIHGQHPHVLDGSALLYLQHRLIDAAEDAGLVELTNSAAAKILPWSDQERATLERFTDDARRLLFDAGCRVFNSNFASQLPLPRVPDEGASPEQQTKLEINVPTAPPPGGELELNYCGLWARGYWDSKGFVVLAGADVRYPINASTRQNIGSLRLELENAQVLIPIPDLQDRRRLAVSIRCFSAAVAAKVLTGAHVSATKWLPPRHPQTPIAA